MVGIFLQPFFYTLRFLYDIASNEAVGYLVCRLLLEKKMVDGRFGSMDQKVKKGKER